MRSKAIQISLLFFLLAIGFPTLSQKTIVKGVVLDKATHTTLPFATLFFLGPKTGTTSDLDGKFVFETYYSSDTLVCTMVGYTPLKKP